MQHQKVNPFKSAAIKLFVASNTIVICVIALYLAGRALAWWIMAAVAIADMAIMVFLKRRGRVL